MPRYTNKLNPMDQSGGTQDPANQNQSAQGGQTTASQDVQNMNLTDAPADGSTPSSGVIPKQTTVTGTNFKVPGRVIVPNKNDFHNAQYDSGFDPSFKGKNTLSRTGAATYTYYGPQLIDEYGHLAGPGYDAGGADINSEFHQASKSDQQMLLNSALKMGFYFGQKPSGAALSGTGTSNTDDNAIQMFFDYSTRAGRTWRAVSGMLNQGLIAPATGVGGGGPRVSVVSKEEAAKGLYDAFYTILKRPPTPEEIKQSALNIQNMERSRGQGGSMDAPSLKTAAQLEAQKTSPNEATAVSVGSAVTRLFALLAGG